MKKLFVSCFCVLVGLLFVSVGCHEAPIGNDFADLQYNAKGAVVSAENVVNGFFDLGDPDNSFIAFDLASKGEAVSGVGINVAYEGGGETSFGTGSVPGSVNVTMNDVLSAVGVSLGDVEIGDEITFTFDGTSSSGTFRSSESLVIPFSCFSDLGGTHSFVSTNFQAITGSCPTDPVEGTVTWTDLGGGKYMTSDLGFGQYGTTCWNDSPATSGNATFSDVCNQLISGGLDQYSLTYIWVITDVSGSELTMSWTNDYDDSGDVVLTREGGADWPPLYTN
jgi:hypothetical protein